MSADAIGQPVMHRRALNIRFQNAKAKFDVRETLVACDRVSRAEVCGVGDQSQLAVEEFRIGNCIFISRLHMQTVAALLAVDFRETSMDYLELLRLTRFVTQEASASEQVYRRMVFNARTHNRDDHLKNHAFLMDAQGIWRLAPAYDVAYSPGPGGEHTLTIADEGRRPGRDAFAAVASKSGITKRRAAEIVDEVDAVLADWRAYADATGVPPNLRLEIGEHMEHAAKW